MNLEQMQTAFGPETMEGRLARKKAFTLICEPSIPLLIGVRP